MSEPLKKTNFSCALNEGLRILSRQNLSRKEFTQKLLAKNFSGETVDAVLHHCEERGYLNEEERAMQVVRTRLRSGHGPIRIRMELAKRGISEDLGEKTLNEALAGKENPLKSAALKKLAGLSEPDPRKKRAKLYRFLLAKGYPSADITDFIRQFEDLFSGKPNRS